MFTLRYGVLLSNFKMKYEDKVLSCTINRHWVFGVFGMQTSAFEMIVHNVIDYYKLEKNSNNENMFWLKTFIIYRNLNKRHIKFNFWIYRYIFGLFESVFDNLSKRFCQFSRPVIFLFDRKHILNILIRLLRRQVRLWWQSIGVLLYTCVLMDKF